MPYRDTCEGRLFYAYQPGPNRSGYSGHLPDTMICLHGAGGTHQHWLRIFQQMATICPLLAPDLPGHGHSPGPGRTRIADYSKVLIALLDSLELDQVVVAGHSMGGAVALWTALEYPERIARLILISTGSRLPVLPALLTHLEQGNHAESVRIIIERAYGSGVPQTMRERANRVMQSLDPQILYGDLLACASYSTRDRLSQVRCPTLVICGDDDQVTPLKFSHTLHQEIIGAQLEIIPGAGHMVLLEYPDQVVTILRKFIANPSP